MNPTGNEDMTRIRNFFAALSRRFRGFRGTFAGFAAVSRRFRAASHTAQWCLRKDSQPFRKVSQLRIRVISSLPVGFGCSVASHLQMLARSLRLHRIVGKAVGFGNRLLGSRARDAWLDLWAAVKPKPYNGA